MEVRKEDQRDQDEKVVEIEIERLRDFKNHPFKVQADSQMKELQKIIADIITETCGITCWVYVEKYVHCKSLKEMLEERKEVDKFILVIDTWFEKILGNVKKNYVVK